METLPFNTFHFIAKCKGGHVVKATIQPHERVNGWLLRCSCGQVGEAKFMKVTVNAEKRCTGICTGASGPNCECSCGGHNHGATRTAG